VSLKKGLAHNHRFLISRCPVPHIQLAGVVIGWGAHAVSHKGVGPEREPLDLCIRYRWTGRGTDSFLGQVSLPGAGRILD
jgi:hypothetical protein